MRVSNGEGTRRQEQAKYMAMYLLQCIRPFFVITGEETRHHESATIIIILAVVMLSEFVEREAFETGVRVRDCCSKGKRVDTEQRMDMQKSVGMEHRMNMQKRRRIWSR